MSEAADASAPALDFDLYVSTGPARLVWNFRDHKVTLVDDRIVWTVDGRPVEAKLDDIAEIHLTAGGGVMSGDGSPAYMRVVAGRQRPYPSFCRIHLRNGGLLRVMDAGSSGLGDADRAKAYSEFVVRLHERLSARPRGPITLSAGYSPVRYRILQVALGLMGLLTLGALIALILGERPRHFLALIAGMVAFGFQVAMVRRNAPQGYDLAHVPEGVLPARVPHHAGTGPGHGAAKPPLPRPALRPRAAPAALDTRMIWAAVAVVGLAVAAWIGWEAGIAETARMFEPGEAQRALAAIEAKAGGPLRLRRLNLTPRALVLTVEAQASHVDRQGLISRTQTWTVTHATFYSGWSEWDEVSGPDKADALPGLTEATTKVFTLRPADLADLTPVEKAAIEHTGLASRGSVTDMTLTLHDDINPIAGRDPLRWLVGVATPDESAEIVLDRNGGYIDGDFSNTRRVRDLDLLSDGKALNDILAALHSKIGDASVGFLRVTPKTVDVRTEDKRYVADLQGIVDRTPAFFYCHATMDILAGRFVLDGITGAAVKSVLERARDAARRPQGGVEAVSLAMPPMTMDRPPPGPLWTVVFEDAAVRTSVIFARTGELLRIDENTKQNVCD